MCILKVAAITLPDDFFCANHLSADNIVIQTQIQMREDSPHNDLLPNNLISCKANHFSLEDSACFERNLKRMTFFLQDNFQSNGGCRRTDIVWRCNRQSRGFWQTIADMREVHLPSNRLWIDCSAASLPNISCQRYLDCSTSCIGTTPSILVTSKRPYRTR